MGRVMKGALWIMKARSRKSALTIFIYLEKIERDA
jgi:hypothetical protein